MAEAELLRDASGRLVKVTTEEGATPRGEHAFLKLLHNRGKERKRGFFVAVHDTGTLQPLQALCLRQSYNTCLTARYRVASFPLFGTLLAAFVEDLRTLDSSDRPTTGDILPPYGAQRMTWQRLIDATADLTDTQALAGDHGTLQLEVVEDLFAAVAGVLNVGYRLVLFAEMPKLTYLDSDEIREWRFVFDRLLPLLPERTGIVVGGAHVDAAYPIGDPHVMRISDIPEATGADVYRYKLSALRGDQPAARDLLGFRPLADALARLILLPQTDPLVIGIHGPWGKGKSSFMRFVDDALVQHAPSNTTLAASIGGDAGDWRRSPKAEQMRKNARRDVVAVHFNAWRYEDAMQIWAGLAQSVTAQLERVIPPVTRAMTPLAYAWRNRRAQILLDLVLPALVLLLAGVLAVVAGWDTVTTWAEKELGSLGALVPATLVGLAGVGLLAARLQKVLRPVSDRIMEYARMPDYRDQTGYQQRVLDDIRFVRDRVTRATGTRVVIFIDDLDRCAEDKVMDLLQAVHLILGASDFYVFLGIDTEMIHRAIGRHYGAEPPLPKGFAERYLRKIVQLPFHLPPVESTDEFLASLFSPAAREQPDNRDEEHVEQTELEDPGEGLAFDRRRLQPPVVQVLHEVEDTPAELEAFVDFRTFIEDNPRELKRLVNVHRLVKILLQRPESPVPRELQRKLVKWLVFCAAWPDLVDDALAKAEQDPDNQDVLAAIAGDDARVERLAAQKDGADRLAAADLAPGGLLAATAYVTQLIALDALPAPEPEEPDEPGAIAQ